MVTSAGVVARGARLPALDGLRGVAAVAVFFYHALPYWPLSEAVRTAIDVTPFGPLCNGPGAVHVFFVLSGYVLALTLEGDTGRGRLPRYWVRRAFRIHPPYVAAVLLAFAASRGRLHVPAARLPVALAFPSMAFGLLPVGWSLYVEMAMSLIFPLLLFLGRLRAWLPLALSLPFLADLDPRIGFLRFAIDFALGLLLRLEAERLAKGLARLPAIAPLVALAAGLVVLQLPLVGSTLGHAGLERGHSGAAVVQFAAAASLLVVATLHAPSLRCALATPIARFFGRVSYSLYLVHYTVLMVVMEHLAPASLAQAVVATVAAFAVSVALAEIGWRVVERPAIEAGRWVIRAFSGRASAA